MRTRPDADSKFGETTAIADRTALVRKALSLEWLTIAWMTVEATVAIASGIAAHSVSLLAFGLDSVIELASAALLLWWLRLELNFGRHASLATEARVGKLAGALLFALAAYVVVSASISLQRGRGEDFSLPGIAVAAAALPIMFALSKGKLSIAARLGSAAMRSDAVESIACGYLSLLVLVGFSAQWLLRAWWVDAVTSYLIVGFLIKEGLEAWRGSRC